MPRVHPWLYGLIALTATLTLIFFHSFNPANATTVFEKLLMPGELSTAHAKLEEKCEACHKPFSKEAQDGLCLDCHKEVAADRSGKSGFHGKSTLSLNQSCNACHSDHLGRDADIVGLDHLVFDHKLTNYPLDGAHKVIPCDSCHAAGKKMRAASVDCFSCHKASEPHQGRLGKTCESCHTADGWRRLKPYEHDKSKFKLVDAHTKIGCMTCHVGEVYADLQSTCWDCHKLSDVHDTQLGKACEDCHSQTAWKPAKFDHDKTRFRLTDKHAGAKCQDCHKPNQPLSISTECKSCHTDEDAHKGQLGGKCDDCHSAKGWRVAVNFDHDLTDFPIVGLHAVVPCEGCHATAEYKDASTGCAACHKADDVHLGRLTADCALCHSEIGWARWDFDHGRKTRFALTGKHQTMSCYGCHIATNVKSASLPTDCYSCHSKQDVHKGKFGTDCARCHDTTTFGVAFIPK